MIWGYNQSHMVRCNTGFSLSYADRLFLWILGCLGRGWGRCEGWREIGARNGCKEGFWWRGRYGERAISCYDNKGGKEYWRLQLYLCLRYCG